MLFLVDSPIGPGDLIRWQYDDFYRNEYGELVWFGSSEKIGYCASRNGSTMFCVEADGTLDLVSMSVVSRR